MFNKFNNFLNKCIRVLSVGFIGLYQMDLSYQKYSSCFKERGKNGELELIGSIFGLEWGKGFNCEVELIIKFI